MSEEVKLNSDIEGIKRYVKETGIPNIQIKDNLWYSELVDLSGDECDEEDCNNKKDTLVLQIGEHPHFAFELSYAVVCRECALDLWDKSME